MRKVLGQDLHKMSFPLDHTEEEKPKTRRCMSYGKTTSTFSCDKLTLPEVAISPDAFTTVSPKKNRLVAYYGENNIELPVKFSIKSIDIDADSMTSFGEAITPGILPIDFFTGQSHQPSYEFYYPSIVARQLGFGQLPVRLFFTDLVKPRETVSNRLEYDRLKSLVLDAETIDLEGWITGSFTTKPFKQWCLEWSLHLFCASAKTYYQ
jgi:hypothetical protein